MDQARLLECIKSQLKIASELLAILKEEEQAIAGRDLLTILDICQRKQETADRLASADLERQRVAEACALPLELPGLEVKLRPSAAESANLCKDLLTAIRACGELNRRNGRRIESRLGYLRQAFAVVTGQSLVPDLYGPAASKLQIRPRVLATA